MKRFLVVLILGLLVFTGCSSTSSDEEVGGHLVMADAGWDSIRLHNAVVGLVVETVYNYTWEEVPGSSPITWEALKSGEIDIYTEAWTDNLATYNDDIADGTVVEKALNFGDSIQGLYVPAYLVEGDDALAPDLETVQDLAMYADIFPDPDDAGMGRIYGGIPGWNVDVVLRNKYEYLGLDETFNYFSPGSDAALSAVLSDAYEAKEAIVGYYWEPTWLMGKYDFVRLTDEEPYNADTYADGIGDFNATPVTVVVRAGFAEEHPEVDAFLGGYETSSQLTSNALAYMQDTGADYVTTAKWFIMENQDLIAGMLPADDAETLFAALAE